MTDRRDDHSLESENNGLRDRLVALTRDLIIIPSTARRPADRERCYQSVHNHIDSIPAIEIREFERDGYRSLVASPEGCLVPEVLLCAHLDVVALPEESDYRSAIIDGRIVGPGAGDMKGQLAILLELFHALHHHCPGVPLGLAITSDEEIGGVHGIGYLVEEIGLRCGVAIIPDGGSPEEVTVEEKGILQLRVRAEGRAGHAARPWNSRNALETLVGALTRLRRHFDSLQNDTPDRWFPTCSATALHVDNDTINRIPPRAEALLDVRFPPPHTTATMASEVESVAGEHVSVETIMSGEPTHLAPDPIFLNVVNKITGRQMRRTRESGGSDARFFCRHGIPVIMARPDVGELHAEDEWIDVNSMVSFYHCCERYVHKRLNLQSP